MQDTIRRDHDKLVKDHDLKWRVEQLKALSKGLNENKEMIVKAEYEDLMRPKNEVYMNEIFYVIDEIKFVLENIQKWMLPVEVPHLPAHPMFKGKSIVYYQPKGHVLLIAPWNYPLNLTFSPLVACIASGNSCVIKPSEVSPNCANAIKHIVEKYLDPTSFQVFLGGADVTTDLLQNHQWDHIFYTGGGEIGKIVMTAAAKNLTPVTLELGGKSPVYIDRSADISETVNRIINGKFANNGQTCIAPDYILVHKDVERQFIEELSEGILALANTYDDGKYSRRVVNRRHFDRISRLIDPKDGLKGGFVLMGGLEKSNRETCVIAPTLVINPDPNCKLMQEEIFGPVLPILCVNSVDDAVKFINGRAPPLASYVFAENEDIQNQFILRTRSGGSCVNNVLIHLINPHLPFGGAQGPSGIGAYHGKAGFDELSHKRSVYFHDIPKL